MWWSICCEEWSSQGPPRPYWPGGAAVASLTPFWRSVNFVKSLLGVERRRISRSARRRRLARRPPSGFMSAAVAQPATWRTSETTTLAFAIEELVAAGAPQSKKVSFAEGTLFPERRKAPTPRKAHVPQQRALTPLPMNVTEFRARRVSCVPTIVEHGAVRVLLMKPRQW